MADSPDSLNESYLAIVADVTASRKVSDRAALQRRLEQAVRAVNDQFADALAAKAGIAAGDSIEALLSAPAFAIDVMTIVADLLAPHDIAFGLGWGPIATDPREHAPAIDGPCFHHARAAIEAAKKAGRWAEARGFPADGDVPVNALLRAVGLVRQGWTMRQAEIVAAARRFPTQRELAIKLGVSPSVVSEALKAGHQSELTEFEGALRQLLPAAVDPLALADKAIAQGDLATARRALEAALRLRRDADADVPAALARTSRMQTTLGDVLLQQGRVEEALARYEASLAMRERLAAQDPTNKTWQRDIIASRVELARAQIEHGGSAPRARELMEQNLRALRALQEAGRLFPADAWMIPDHEARLAALAKRKGAPGKASAKKTRRRKR